MSGEKITNYRPKAIHVHEEGIVTLDRIQLDHTHQLTGRRKFGGQMPLLADRKQTIGLHPND
jgi:hypothetical protein